MPVSRRYFALTIAAATCLCNSAFAEQWVGGSYVSYPDYQRWNKPLNWIDGNIANGPGDFAVFSGLQRYTFVEIGENTVVNKIVVSDSYQIIRVLDDLDGAELAFRGTTPQIDIAQDVVATISGSVSADSRLEKTGLGRVVLGYYGSSTLDGDVLVSLGTLDLAQDARVTGNVNLAVNGTLFVGNGYYYYLPSSNSVGSLSGSGQLMFGVGDYILNDAQTAFDYHRAELTTNGDNTSSMFDGEIVGTGNLNKLGTGTLTLSGASDAFYGEMRINEGTLSAGSDMALGQSTVYIRDGATLALEDGVTLPNAVFFDGNAVSIHQQGGSSTLAGNLQAGQAMPVVTKTGAGEIILNGAPDATNTLPSPSKQFVAAEGLLTFNTQTDADVLAAGGTVGGTGTILGSLQINNDGRVAPGNSVGTLHVANTVTFATGSVYAVELNANGSSDKLVTEATATLAGNVLPINVSSAEAYAPTQTYTILTSATAVNGTFDSVVDDAALVDYAMSYDAKNAYLIRTIVDPVVPETPVTPETPEAPVTPETPDPPVTPEAPTTPSVLPNFVGPANSYNTFQVAQALLGFNFSSDPDLLESLLPLSKSALNAAYNQLTGQIHAEINGAVQNLTTGFDTILMNKAVGDASGSSNAPQVTRMQSAATMPTAHPATWVSLSRTRASLDGDGNASGSDMEMLGIAGGVSRQFANFAMPGETTIGAALGYSQSHLDLNDVAQSANLETVHVGVYGASGAGRLEEGGAARVALSYARTRVETERDIAFGTVQRKATSSYDAESYGAALEGRYNRVIANAYGQVAVSPFAGLRIARSDVASFKEAGAGALNLSGSAVRNDFASLRLGVSTAADITLGAGQSLSSNASIAYERVLSDVSGAADISLTGSPDRFTVLSPGNSRNRLHLSLDVSYQVGAATDLTLSAEGMISQSRSAGTIVAGLNYQF